MTESKKKILVIDAKVLNPDGDGRSLRMYNLLKIFKICDYDVTFIASELASWPPFSGRLEKDTRFLEESGIEVVSGSDVDSVEQYLQQMGHAFNIVIVSGAYVAYKHMDSVLRLASQATVVFDTTDLAHVREYRHAKLLGSLPLLKESLKLKECEFALARKADYTLVVSPAEKAIFQVGDPQIQVCEISNIHEAYGCARPFSKRKDIIFVGTYQHRPNVDAMVYFVNEIFELVRKGLDGVKLYIIGTDPPQEIQRLRAEDVIVTGHVKDLSPYFSKCKLSIAPLRFGAGVKNKVQMSMGYGVPVVGSSIAAEGMAVVDGRDMLIADSPRDFCKAIVTLYSSEVLWEKLSRNGLDFIDDRFSFESTRRQIESLLLRIKQDKSERVES